MGSWEHGEMILFGKVCWGGGGGVREGGMVVVLSVILEDTREGNSRGGLSIRNIGAVTPGHMLNALTNHLK